MSEPWRLGKLTRTRTDGSKYWHYAIKWTDGSGPHRVSLGTSDKVAANTAARAFWSQRALVDANNIGTIVDAYLAAIDGRSDHPRKEDAWKAAAPFWAKLALNDVDADTSRVEYPEWRQRSLNTIRVELGLVRVALGWARDEKKLITTIPKIVLPPIPESDIGHLTKDQFRTFLEGCRAPHVRLFAILAVTTGARKTALLQLKWERVDFVRRLLDLRPKDYIANAIKGRGIKPVNDRLLAALCEAQEGAVSEYVIEQGGKPLANIKKGVAAAAQRSGIHCTPHMFRHSAAVWMAEDRVPMSEIAAFLDHKNSRITERVYARYHPDYLREASRSLDW
jgi:integrase